MFTNRLASASLTRTRAPFRRSLWRSTGPASGQDDNTPVLLTMAEASAALRVSRWSLYQLIRRGKLQTIKIGRRRLVPSTALVTLVEQLRGEEYF